MHVMKNIKITGPRFEVDMTVQLHINFFCHVTPGQQFSTSARIEKPQIPDGIVCWLEQWSLMDIPVLSTESNSY
jgi:hypothetical protein